MSTDAKLIVNNILKTKSIVEYLSKKGHNPVRSSNGKLFYKCPLPDHSETKPSFVVYTNEDYEKFYCFGCQKNYNIIHLVSFLEGIPIKDAISKLADGVSVSDIDETVFLKSMLDSFEPYDKIDVIEALNRISSYCRYYEKNVNRDPDEVAVIDNFYKMIDEYLLNADFESIIEASKHIRYFLEKRKEKYIQLKKNKLFLKNSD